MIEGKKFVKDAEKQVQFTFQKSDTKQFHNLVSTQSPQNIAAVASIPLFTKQNITKKSTIVVLDGVQDPGNVGTIFRLCLGFDASLILVESADPSSPKAIRASASAFFKVPWVTISRQEAVGYIYSLQRNVYRLEKRQNAISPKSIKKLPAILLVGSEGMGITLPIEGTSVTISTNTDLDSLNVAAATAIILYERTQ